MNTIGNQSYSSNQYSSRQAFSSHSDSSKSASASGQINYGDNSPNNTTSNSSNSESSSDAGFFKKMTQGIKTVIDFVIQACIKLAPFVMAGAAVAASTAAVAAPMMASPLTVDLDGDGNISTTDINKKYDIDGDGDLDNTAWVGEGDGILAFDADGDGISGENGTELLGNNSDINGDGQPDGYDNGFEALEALAEKHIPGSTADGVLDEEELAILEEEAGLVILESDGTKSDKELTSIDLGYSEDNSFTDENGNEHRQVGNGVVIDGEQRAMNDVWYQYTE